MSAPERVLRTPRGELRLGAEPWLMGIVNASPDSFSDGGLRATTAERVEFARALVRAGASVIDIGGESGVTNTAPVAVEEEIARVVPLIRRVSELGVVVSVDTYKPAVAAAALEAGAAIVNDVSGLRDPALADVCAAHGGALIITHTRAAPKQKLLDPALDGVIVADVHEFLSERMALAEARGMAPEQIALDPGPDLGKTPAQTVAALRAFEGLHELGRPLLLAVSRKDFIGVITSRRPRERLAGTLAAVAFGVQAGAHLLRVHDVAATHDFLAVRAVLDGDRELESGARLADELRRQRSDAAGDNAAALGAPGPPPRPLG